MSVADSKQRARARVSKKHYNNDTNTDDDDDEGDKNIIVDHHTVTERIEGRVQSGNQHTAMVCLHWFRNSASVVYCIRASVEQRQQREKKPPEHIVCTNTTAHAHTSSEIECERDWGCFFAAAAEINCEFVLFFASQTTERCHVFTSLQTYTDTSTSTKFSSSSSSFAQQIASAH